MTLALITTNPRTIVTIYDDIPNPLLLPNGIYRTSRTDIVHLGSAFNRWDGKEWREISGWGDYSAATNLVWQGCGPKLNDPFPSVPK